MTRNRPVSKLSKNDQALIRSLVIYESADILAFNKPSGLPVQTRGNHKQNLDHLLWAFAKSNGKRPKLVHRVDSETSGVLIVAKNYPMSVHLSRVFATGQAEKTYHAIVEGKPIKESQGIIDVPLVIRPNNAEQNVVVGHEKMSDAKPAKTLWKVLSRNHRRTLLKLTPKTGRTHQLRVHLTSIGNPILGDRMYGTGRLSAKRLMLHAIRLTVPLPNSGKMTFEAPWPDDFEKLATQAFPDYSPFTQNE